MEFKYRCSAIGHIIDLVSIESDVQPSRQSFQPPKGMPYNPERHLTLLSKFGSLLRVCMTFEGGDKEAISGLDLQSGSN